MRFHTVRGDGIDRVYHWQPFNADYLRTYLRDGVIRCSDPASFNDPWDCKPHFNTEILADPVENERHVQWACGIAKRYNTTMSDSDIAGLAARLRADRIFAASKIDEISRGMWAAISARYRVYCLGPDGGNLLMWAHYAKNHTGICLEFSTRDTVMCCALRVEYLREFPLVRAYSTDLEENLRPLLVKSDVWAYEREYRLIAQERGNATNHDTLFTDNNFLKLPERALRSVIVGCQGPYEEVKTIVSELAPQVAVKRAKRVPNRFELRIE